MSDYITRSDPGVTNETCQRASRMGVPNSCASAFKDADYGTFIVHYPEPISTKIARIAWVASAVMLAGSVTMWVFG